MNARPCLLFVACAAFSLAEDSAKNHADKAAEFVQHGDLKSAESELRKAVDLSPANPTLLTSLGGVLGMEGQFKQANVFLAQAVKLQPDEPMLRRNLAANEWQLGRFQEARRDLELLLRADPNDKGATFLLGMVSENEKNYRRSIALLESIPDVAEHQPEASVALASSYYHTNQNQKARAALKNVLNRPANPQVLMMAGRVAIDAHDYPLALTILTEAAGAMPDSYQVSLLKSQAEMKLRYFSQAVTSAQRATELHPSVDTKRELAFAEWHAGDRDHALSGFEELMRQFPRDAETYETYGSLLLEGGAAQDKARAIELLKRAIALDGSSVEALYQLGNIELADGQLEAARKNLERAVQVNPDDSRPHFALSRVYRRLGRNSDADRELESYQKLKARQS
jgi:tetratricopeptide (TPR) repeat protein